MSNTSSHFHLTLPSNSSMNIYLNNMTYQYVTTLPICIELDGDWSVLLKEIATPISLVNAKANTRTFQILNKEKGRVVNRSLPADVYISSMSVIRTQNRIMSRSYDIMFLLQIKDNL